ncbi:MAG TPA: transporter [Candidatus Limnocylindrales bacterium]|nr:transporter [Candidatus Limnocylindrales bacterium]
MLRTIHLAFALAATAAAALAQGNYEVQVYGSELVAPKATMVELHSNFTASGQRQLIDGVLPTNHAEHETLEITHGWNEWFETGFYQFTSIQPDGSWEWVGTHIRPRVAIPERYHLPVGISVSTEIGYQRPIFSGDTWTWEIRPIVDKKMGRWYWSVNPTIDKSFHGPEQHRGYEFAPNVKVSYDVTKKAAFGLEYYGEYGPVVGWDPVREEQQQFIPAVDLDFGKNWEFNFGVGVGVTAATDHLLVKMILGYRFNAHDKP